MLLGILGTYIFLEKTGSTHADSCHAEKSPLPCFAEKAHHKAMGGDIEGAIAYAQEMIGPLSQSSLHMAMHMIGHAAYDASQGYAAAMAILPPELEETHAYFSYEGYQHGILQALFMDKKDDTPMQELMREGCGEFYVSESAQGDDSLWRERKQCFHAVGHALMYAHENDMDTSIRLCADLPYAWAQEQCAYGVFMELSYSYSPEYRGTKISVTNEPMLKICERAPMFQGACMRLVGRSHLIGNPHDFKGTFEVCKTLPEEAAIECRRDLAQISITGRSSNFEEMRSKCSAGGEFESECLMNVAYGIKKGYAGKGLQSQNFCSTLAANLQRECNEYVVQ